MQNFPHSPYLKNTLLTLKFTQSTNKSISNKRHPLPCTPNAAPPPNDGSTSTTPSTTTTANPESPSNDPSNNNSTDVNKTSNADENDEPELALILIACGIGIATGAGVVVFNDVIHAIRDSIWHGETLLTGRELLKEFSELELWPRVVLPPILGGLFVGSLSALLDGYEDQTQATGTVVVRNGDAAGSTDENGSVLVTSTGTASLSLLDRLFSAKRPIARAIAAAVTLGTGASLGPEGPSVDIGKSCASGIGSILRSRERHVTSLLAAGSGAGVAAGFNAPIAGVFFAVETVLQKQVLEKDSATKKASTSATNEDPSGLTIAMILLASVVAAVVSQAGLGSSPAFRVPAYRLESLYELPLYLVFGALCGVVSASFSYSTRVAADAFEELRGATFQSTVMVQNATGGGLLGRDRAFLSGDNDPPATGTGGATTAATNVTTTPTTNDATPQSATTVTATTLPPLLLQQQRSKVSSRNIISRICLPAIGGLTTGVLALGYPEILYQGFDNVNSVLSSSGEYAPGLLIQIVVVKIIATAISRGSGLQGGLYAPSIFIGAALGSAFGLAVHAIGDPSGVMLSAPQAYALVGVGAMLASNCGVPLTAVLLLFELTRDYLIIVPTLAAVGISFWISSLAAPSVRSAAARRRAAALAAAAAVSTKDDVALLENLKQRLRAGALLQEQALSAEVVPLPPPGGNNIDSTSTIISIEDSTSKSSIDSNRGEKAQQQQRALTSDALTLACAADTGCLLIRDDMTLAAALTLMDAEQRTVAVVVGNENGGILGVVSRDVVQASELANGSVVANVEGSEDAPFF